MNCPKCNGKSKTKDTRKKPGMIMRRHECFECHHRFTTYEIWADDYDELKKHKQTIMFLKKIWEIREGTNEQR